MRNGLKSNKGKLKENMYIKYAKQENLGITLIALVITIIILLIMAGVVLNLALGENGIISGAKKASENTEKARIQEELEAEIANVKIKLVQEENNREMQKQDIVDRLDEIGAEVTDYNDEIIEGEYKGYEYKIDENNKVIIGGALTGAIPTATFELSTTQEGVEELELKVIAQTTEGDIASIESLNKLELVSENGTSEKTYKVTLNGEYKFKIVGTNKRTARVSTKITNLQNIIISESLLKGIEEINIPGEVKVRVIGKTTTNEPILETYPLNVVYHKGNLSIGDKLTSEGNEVTINELSKVANTAEWRAGKIADANTNSVVLKVDGDLTLEENYKLSSVKNGTAVGKGLFIYCTGTLTINGTIDMSSVSCSAASQDVYLWKRNDGTYNMITKAGATGGVGTVQNVAGSRKII